MMGVGQILLSTTTPLLKIWPAARMVVKCACDLILILERALRLHGPDTTADEIERAQDEYASGHGTDQQSQNHAAVVARISPRDWVHLAINETFPLQKKFFRKLGIKKAESLIANIIRNHRIGAPRRQGHSRKASSASPQDTLLPWQGVIPSSEDLEVIQDELLQPDQSSPQDCQDEFDAMSQALDAMRQDPTSDEDGTDGDLDKEPATPPSGPEDEDSDTNTIPDSLAADSEVSRVPSEDADSWSGGVSAESLQASNLTPDDDQALEVEEDSGWADGLFSGFG